MSARGHAAHTKEVVPNTKHNCRQCLAQVIFKIDRKTREEPEWTICSRGPRQRQIVLKY